MMTLEGWIPAKKFRVGMINKITNQTNVGDADNSFGLRCLCEGILRGERINGCHRHSGIPEDILPVQRRALETDIVVFVVRMDGGEGSFEVRYKGSEGPLSVQEGSVITLWVQTDEGGVPFP